MSPLALSNQWFHKQRHLLFDAWAGWALPSPRPEWADAGPRDRRSANAIREGCAAHDRHAEDTERMLGRLPRRHERATRAHMQLFRACLEATSIVPANDLMHAAVQIEWLWHTTPFKRFYRDHLAHVMKVATTALVLWREPGVFVEGALIDTIAARLAAREAGSEALRRIARRLGNEERVLRDPCFWRQAVLEATRLACLLHDLAYPSIMSGKYVANAAAVTDPLGAHLGSAQKERAHKAQHLLELADGHLLMLPFQEEDATSTALDLRQPHRTPAGDAAFAELALTSHSLQAGLRILQFGAEADKRWRLTPLEAFVIEWAAAAAALHDYDKAFELHIKRRNGDQKPGLLADWFNASERGVRNTEHIRPSILRDPVSYMVALADQLQDFGRIHLDASDRAPDEAKVKIAAPVASVSLRRDPGENVVHVTWHLANSAGGATNAVRTGKLGDPSSNDVIKRRGAKHLVFAAPDADPCWLDHGGLFRFEVNVEPAT